MKRKLIIVDVQRDFIAPDTLPVGDAGADLEKIRPLLPPAETLRGLHGALWPPHCLVAPKSEKKA